MKRFFTTAAAACAIFAAAAATPLYLDDSQPLEARIDDALSRMTLREKVRLCYAQGKFSSPGVPRLGIPGLMMSDGPHGVRAEINWNDWKYAGWTNDSITAFPALTALAATFNPQLAEAYGRALGDEALYRGKNVILGPGVNICRTPLNGRNFEYMGEDPVLAGEMAVPYVRGLQSRGVAACVKHFALNNQEQDRGNIDVAVSDRALHEIYLPAFRRALIDGGAWSLMGAYNRYRGEHCCHNKALLVDLLRDKWGWDGSVITDWGGAHDTRQAAMNGLDIEMGTHTDGLTTDSSLGYDTYFLGNEYLRLLESGELPDSTVNAKARNILRLIMRTSMRRDRDFGSLTSSEHYEVARAIGNEAIVLLKNNGILPLDTLTAGRILVVGENAVRNLSKGGGSSELKPRHIVTPLDALREVYGADRVSWQEGYRSGPALYNKERPAPADTLAALRARAVEAARQADVVIYIGGLNKNGFQDCEASDRRSFSLPWGQDELIAELADACPRLIVANISGNAYAMPWIDRPDAVIQSWYLGTMGGASLADVIAGRVNPSGKLPFSFPRRLEDVGAHAMGPESYPGVIGPDSLPTQTYKEDILVGYRWHDAKRIPALFPFGHGLSYTTFAYGKPVLSSAEMTADGTVTVSVPVTNTGTRAGSETVMLYVGAVKPPVMRPVKELKHFSKVSLPTGETATVTFTLTPDDLARYDEATAAFTADPGRYRLTVGPHTATLRLR